MLIRIEHVASTDDGLIFKEPISGAVIVLTDAQADAIGLMYNDIHDIIEAAGRLAKAAELPPTQGQALKGQLTIPGLVARQHRPPRTSTMRKMSGYSVSMLTRRRCRIG